MHRSMETPCIGRIMLGLAKISLLSVWIVESSQRQTYDIGRFTYIGVWKDIDGFLGFCLDAVSLCTAMETSQETSQETSKDEFPYL